MYHVFAAMRFNHHSGARRSHLAASAIVIPRAKRKQPPGFHLMAVIYVGDDLLSHTLSRAVQSARRGLTSVFGMGTGISPAVRSPASQACARGISQLGPQRRPTQDLERQFSKNSPLDSGLKPRKSEREPLDGTAKAVPFQVRSAQPAGDLSQLNSIRDTGPGSPSRSACGRFTACAPSKFYGQAERAISTGKLHALLRFHIQPIKHVVFVCPS